MRSLALPLLCALTGYFLSTPAHAANLEQQRRMYDEAKQALSKGDSAPYKRYANALRDYPLEPHLAYDELTARLKSASDEEVEAFLAEHGDLPQISWMKLRWLRWQAERGNWNNFVRYYDPKLNFAELDCLYGQYLYQHNMLSEAREQAKKLWLVGKSQHQACDALFSTWKNDGQLTEDLRWQRAKLAAEAGNLNIASYLVKGLQQLSPQGNLLLEVSNNPQLVSQTQRFNSADPYSADIASLGLRRLSKQNTDKALELLQTHNARLNFSSTEKLAIARDIALPLAKRFDDRALPLMAQYDAQLQNNNVSEWRARLLLRNQRWSEAHQLTQRMPTELASSSRWRYWQARSLQLAQPNSAQAELLYSSLAQERDFYGFLAADRSQTAYSLNHQAAPITPQTLQKVRNSAGVRRALEFLERGQIGDARREWYHVGRLFSRDELIAQAKLAYDRQWYFPAIHSISQARYWDDLTIRFPMAHQNILVNQAKQRGLPASWLFAITRQESAFMADARSHAGAMGLMQLMPGTAKETAQRYGISLSNPQQALLPEKNIQLGAAYLSQVHNQFKGNRILASAAYNAGPGRVRQWLRGTEHLPFDIWVENIPFDETRQYVQNVMTYAVIYSDKLGSPHRMLDMHERFFDEQ